MQRVSLKFRPILHKQFASLDVYVGLDMIHLLNNIFGAEKLRNNGRYFANFILHLVVRAPKDAHFGVLRLVEIANNLI
jgi:hypothetical protein